MIIGTAGHIDHGKSTLVTALTGRPMDRLVEERRRGITIDLNFAPLEFDGLPPVGIVDVPGHEDFIRTMVAGASGIDLVLLVVDAVEGIRPQTLEHLAIVEQLGIPRGIPVLTKCDLAEPDWIDLVEADLHERLARSSVVFEPVARVSSVTGAGIPELRERLRRLAEQPVRRPSDLLRLPIDRAFAIAGVGTVVTGTLWSGTAAVGDQVRVEPGGLEGRVRSVESFGRAMEAAIPGSRTALGLAGLDHGEIVRGRVVVAADRRWPATTVMDASIALLSDAPRALARGTRVRLLLGTAEVMGRVSPRVALRPGGSAPTRLVLESAIVARGGDRFVLRSYSPVATIGGGWVADPEPPRRSTWPDDLTSPDPARRLVALLERRPNGIPSEDVARLIGPRDSVTGTGAGVVEISGRLILSNRVASAREALLAALGRFHVESPAAVGLSLETLRASLGKSSWLAEHALKDLSTSGIIRISQGLAALASHAPTSVGGESEVAALVALVVSAGFDGLTAAALGERMRGKDVQGALRIALSSGAIEAVERDRYVGAETLTRVAEVLRLGGQGNALIEPALLRDQLGLSRKNIIPLLEWADRKGITWRDRAGIRRLKGM